MAFRTLMIENPAYLSLKSSQLIIRTDSEHSVPVEDISALLLENRQITITAAALSALGQSGCCVYVCDEAHLPCAVFEPYLQHSRANSVFKKQLSVSLPQQKRLWQQIVTAKIRNQALCLRFSQKEDAALLPLIDRVHSGDPENTEATAAMKYFPLLFGEGFKRTDENGQNAALNYGYAVIRGYMARTLAVYGFLPALGIHHCNELNSFNLADDLMEPFRPVIDQLVVRHIDTDAALLPEYKRMLVNSLNLDVLSGGQKHSVSYAIERLVQSLARRLEDGTTELLLPELLLPSQHCYE